MTSQSANDSGFSGLELRTTAFFWLLERPFQRHAPTAALHGAGLPPLKFALQQSVHKYELSLSQMFLTLIMFHSTQISYIAILNIADVHLLCSCLCSWRWTTSCIDSLAATSCPVSVSLCGAAVCYLKEMKPPPFRRASRWVCAALCEEFRAVARDQCLDRCDAV